MKFEDLKLPLIIADDRTREMCEAMAKRVYDQMHAHYEAKLAEAKPAWRLPDPPPGQRWHRDDWTQDMLPDGYRPLLDGEEIHHGDEYNPDGDKNWIAQNAISPTNAIGMRVIETTGSWWKHRTRRPLPAPVEYVPLGPGDVPPGSAVRWPDCNWVMVSLVCESGLVRCNEEKHIPWEVLKDGGAEILRPGSATWEPCKKPKP